MDSNSGGFNYILFVEDDENDALGLKLACIRSDLTTQVRRVSSGQEAMDYLAGNAPYSDRSLHPLPSLVLLDWKMPGLSGMDVLQWMRAQPGLKHVVVIVLSGLADRVSRHKALEMGANSFIEKPRTVNGFQEILAHLAGHSSFHGFPDGIESTVVPLRRQVSAS